MRPLSQSGDSPPTTWTCQGWRLPPEGARAALSSTRADQGGIDRGGQEVRTDLRLSTASLTRMASSPSFLLGGRPAFRPPVFCARQRSGEAARRSSRRSPACRADALGERGLALLEEGIHAFAPASAERPRDWMARLSSCARSIGWLAPAMRQISWREMATETGAALSAISRASARAAAAAGLRAHAASAQQGRAQRFLRAEDPPGVAPLQRGGDADPRQEPGGGFGSDAAAREHEAEQLRSRPGGCPSAVAWSRPPTASAVDRADHRRGCGRCAARRGRRRRGARYWRRSAIALLEIEGGAAGGGSAPAQKAPRHR